MDDPAPEERAISEDISPSGIKILVKNEIKQNARISLKFNMPDDESTIAAQARVVWTKKREEQFYEIGLEFVSIDDIYLDRINTYVKKTLGIVW